MRFSPDRMEGIAKGDFAPFSASSINANLTNPWALADAGARNAQRYVIAGRSGGLAAPRKEGP